MPEIGAGLPVPEMLGELFGAWVGALPPSTDSGGRPTAAAYDPGTGNLLEQALEATAEDVDAAVRAANRAYWDHVAEVFGRRC